jgi:hypothetical protein
MKLLNTLFPMITISANTFSQEYPVRDLTTEYGKNVADADTAVPGFSLEISE